MKTANNLMTCTNGVAVVVAILLGVGFQDDVAAAEALHKSISNKEYPKSSVRKNLPPTAGASEGVLQLCGNDRRQNADGYEKARIVKIEAYFSGPYALREGTGFLVSDATVVTAAHNIFSFERRAFADTVTVLFNGKRYGVKEMFTVQGFVSAELDECDYGAITLDTSIAGASAMPYGDDDQSGAVRIAGFPKAEEGGKQLVVDRGAVKERSGGMLWVDNVQTSTGQSGSPVLRRQNDTIAIHTGGRCEGNKPVEKSVRIAGPVKENIDGWKNKPN